MKIDGKALAQQILDDLKQRVEILKFKALVPQMYIITFGNNPQTESYLKQKILKAEYIGAQITIKRFEENIDQKTVYDLIEKLNNDPKVNGIIVQRPMPSKFDEQTISEAVTSTKDIDGFHSNSPFKTPVAEAVIELITKADPNIDLKSKNIVLAGKGITAGNPIRQLFKKLGINTTYVDSQTENKDEIFRNADIIVSAVGKNILNSGNIKNNVILIGVGMHTVEGKLKGDYEEVEVENKSLFYTPTPGGVGPVNVAILMRNLVLASENTLIHSNS